MGTPVDPLAEIARTCDRIDAVDAVIRAFVPEPGRRNRLEAEARSVIERWSQPGDRPALYGVPVGVKDIVHVDGLPTRAGSAVPPEEIGGPQAAVTDRLRAAGALVAGKTETAEFAAAAPGPTRNPHNAQHTPGGSSGGSAAAVAAGMVPLAIGTQTIGSVIRPAAYCGVVGFKPSFGRIPTDGVIANAPTFDTVGLFAADVAGAATAAAALCDAWRPAGGRHGAPVTLGIPAGRYLQRAVAPALAAFHEQVALLRAAGFPVVKVAVFDDFNRIAREMHVVNRYEMARTHAGWFPRFGHLYREQTVAAIREGLGIDRNAYASALRTRTELSDRLATAMADNDVDAWIAPPATGPAPRGLDSTGDPVMCLPWTSARLPVVTVPAGRADSGLPLGLQCAGRPGADEALLALATTIETTLA